MAEQATYAKHTIDRSILDVAGQVMERTGVDEFTATRVAEDMVADVFDKIVFDVAAQVQQDTSIDEDAAYSLAKLISTKAVKEDRDPQQIIEQIEDWAKEQSVKKILLAEVLESIAYQI